MADIDVVSPNQARLRRLFELGRSAAMLAHELSQPVTAAANYLAAASSSLPGVDGTEAETSPRDMLALAAMQLRFAMHIISRIRSVVCDGAPDRSVNEPGAMIRDALQLATFDADRLGVSLHVSLSPDLPERLIVDRVEIQQVIHILVRNAIDAMRDDALCVAGRRELTVAAHGIAGHVVIRVQDTGPGLHPAVRDHLFDPFVTSKSHGMGVGLSICRTIVEAHGGCITAGTPACGGCVMIVTLPVGENVLS